MIHKVLIAACFFSIANLNAQRSDTIFYKGFSFKINLFQLAPGELRITSEKYFHNKHGRSQSIGLISSCFLNYSLYESKFSFPDKPFSSRTGYKLGIDYKCYSKSLKSYINPVFFYSNLSYIGAHTAAVDGFYLYVDANNGLEGDFVKQTYAFQLQKGWISVDFKNHAIVDFYLGLGARVKYFSNGVNGRAPRGIFSIHLGVNVGFLK